MDIVAGVPIGGINFGSPLPPEYANNIAAVVTFGDVADRAGGSLPTQSAMLGSKALDLCNPNDPICHAGPGNEWSGHTEGYVPVYTTQAAAFVAFQAVGRDRPAGARLWAAVAVCPADTRKRPAAVWPADTRIRPADAGHADAGLADTRFRAWDTRVGPLGLADPPTRTGRCDSVTRVD